MNNLTPPTNAATPAGVGWIMSNIRWCRFAQPPANGSYPSGMKTHSLERFTCEPGGFIYQPGTSIHQPGRSIYQPGPSIREPEGSIHQPGRSIHQPGRSIYQPGTSIREPEGSVHRPGRSILQPGGFQAISRGSRRATPTPPDHRPQPIRIPEGCQP
jgi:hypothetical protein